MKTKLNFKSQICTSREQSERLLALGLKKETADCTLRKVSSKVYVIEAMPFCEYVDGIAEDYIGDSYIPAWSLHRLIELAYGNWKEDIAPIYLGNSYDMLIGRIEFQVKQGKFNKEYLV